MRYTHSMSDKTTIQCAPDGPLLIRGLQKLVGIDGAELPMGKSVALCRCGASENKPFCDGAHAAIGFSDDGLTDSHPGGS